MNTKERIKELENRIKKLETENERIKSHSNVVDIQIDLLIKGLEVIDKYFDKIFNKN